MVGIFHRKTSIFFKLNVNVGYLDILDERQQTFVDGDGAFLDLNTRFYNMKGDRIAAHT